MDLEQYETIYPPRNLPEGSEVTRLAPSPTGRPHIGTALQSILDRVIADANNGIFILRIEDTDQQRVVPGAIEEIIGALQWLGVNPDEGPNIGGKYGPYLQSERLPIYQIAAKWLVAKGNAYHCFCTAERLQELRKQQELQGQMPMYDRHCRNLSPTEVELRMSHGEKSVIRLAMPLGAEIRIADSLRGDIVFAGDTIDDAVLLKSDGYPTYHLAVVVDDHFMRVTTAVRGEEWISSTPKHLILFRAFGWSMPRYIHTPLLRDAERKKLSKRRGDTSIDWFQSQGYLPQG